MEDGNKDAFTLREIILNTRKPLILKKNLNRQWTCFDDGLRKWCENYDKSSENKPQFERISIEEANEPQWERKRQLQEMSAVEFLSEHSKECNYWSGLNYKRKDELPAESSNGVEFGCFGFPELTDDCTFWLSSKCANTPCHYDTYGCNIVVQVFGRKSWLLLPPGTPLTTTRIPYEESSVYCLENLYAPNLEESSKLFKLKEQCYHCILEPNDVLIVPRHWWHFVEAMEISLSVNAWIPLTCDADKQIDECVVKHIMENFAKNCTQSTKEYIMNPNQLTAIASDEELFKVLEYLVKQKETADNCSSDPKKGCSTYQYHYLPDNVINALINSTEGVFEVSLMTEIELKNYVTTNSVRCNQYVTNTKLCGTPLGYIQEALINSVCSPHIVELIKQEFYKRSKSNT